MVRPTRRTYLAALATGAVAGCIDATGSGEPVDTNDGHESEPDDERVAAIDGDGQSNDESESEAEDPDSEPLPLGDSPLPLPDDTATLDDSIVSGGVPQDGIPSIDDPQFIEAAAADAWLEDVEPVFGVAKNGDVRAYPHKVLVWHEIVNDVIDGENLAVTYCPLTGTAQGFERGGTEFGVSGKLLNSNLVMYDRATESYWPQMLATAIRGEHEGDVLREFSITWTSWERWREVHPETVVLSDDTGYARDYDRDPYGSYTEELSRNFYTDDFLVFDPYTPVEDSEFGLKEVVLGTRSADGALAVHKESLADAGVLETTLGGVPYVAVYEPALHTGYIYRNPEKRSVEYADGEVTVDGQVHEPDALPLDRVLRYDAFWFAWAGYYPDTDVLT